MRPLTQSRWRLLVIVVSVMLPRLVAGQAENPKRDFVEALGRFSLALNGSYGDEGGRLRAALDALERTAARWDEVIRSYEGAMRAEVSAAAAPLAARMHLALGGVYLDRGRLVEARREFTAAGALDPSRSDAPMFEGLVHQRSNEGSAAIAAFRRAHALEPSNTIVTYTLGREILRTGNTDDAIQVFRQLRDTQTAASLSPPNSAPFLTLELTPERPDIEPFFPPVLYADGFARLRNGDLAGAVTAFRAALSRDPMAVSGIDSGAIAQAASAFRDGDLAAAQQRLSTAIELSPDHAEPHRLIGLVQMAARRYDEAMESMQTAIRLDARDERAHLGLADAFILGGRLDDARQALARTLETFPTSGRARHALGLVYQRQGKYAEARQELAKAAALKPLLGLNSVYQAIGTMARSQQDYDAAIAAFSARVDLVPNDARAHRQLGDMYFRVGQHESAIAEYLVSLTIDRTNADTHTALGQVHLREGRFEEAVTAAKQAVAVDAANKEARYLLATSLLRLGRDDEGRRELDAYQKLQADATSARARQLEVEGLRRDAAVRAAAGDYDTAIALLRKALDREPQSAATQVDLGITLLNASRPAEALGPLTAALSSLAGDPDLHTYLAQAYEALGRHEDSSREHAAANRLMQDALRRTGAER